MTFCDLLVTLLSKTCQYLVTTCLVPVKRLEPGHKPDGVFQRVAHGQRQPLEGRLRVVGHDDDVGDAVRVQDRASQVLQPLEQQGRQHCTEQVSNQHK